MMNKEYVRAVYNALDAYHGGWALKALEENTREARGNTPFEEWVVDYCIESANGLFEQFAKTKL